MLVKTHIEMKRAQLMKRDGYRYKDGKWYFASTDDAQIDIKVLRDIIHARFACTVTEAILVTYALKDICLRDKYIHEIVAQPKVWITAMYDVRFDRCHRRWYSNGRPITYAEANKRYPASILAELRYDAYTY